MVKVYTRCCIDAWLLIKVDKKRALGETWDDTGDTLTSQVVGA